MQGTINFQRDAGQENVRGVETEPDMGRPMSFAIDMRVRSAEALAKLSAALADRNRIIDESSGTTNSVTDLNDAMETLRWTQTQPAFHEWQRSTTAG